ERFTELVGQLVIEDARRMAGPGRDLGGQQSEDDAVLIGRPHRSVAAEERCPGALLTGKAERAVEQAVDEPFEPDRNLQELASELRRQAIDNAAAHDG